MLLLDHRDAVTAVLTDTTLDPALRALIGLRVWQADTDRRRPLGDVLRVVAIQPRDLPEAIHAAVGFPLCWDQAEQPGWAWLNDHGAYFELGYALPGHRLLVIVTDHPDTDATLLFNCHAFADRPVPPVI